MKLLLNIFIFNSGYFKRLQVLAACCSSLAHGGNDTANAIAPLIGIYLLFVYGPIANDEKVASNQWLFAFGGLFMSLGLFALGRRCIETMGEGITESFINNSNLISSI